MKLIQKSALLLLFLGFNSAFAQTRTESLVQKLDNKDAYLVLTQTMSPRVNGTAAKELISVGKPATRDLIQVLDTPNKGIAAHFVLSKIWKDQWEEAICCMIHSEGTVEIVDINGLQIRIENDLLSATDDALQQNKEKWKKRTHA